MYKAFLNILHLNVCKDALKSLYILQYVKELFSMSRKNSSVHLITGNMFLSDDL